MPGPGIELVGAEETAEVMEVLSSGFLSRYGPADNPAFGAKVHKIEGEIASIAGVRYGLGLHGGGSAALWITLLSLGVGAGDEVIVPGFTYVASISAIVYTGATPVLAEIDQSFDLDPADVEARITPRTAAIIVVHMLGGPARLDELKAVADRHGIPLIEDCAQAFGATYKGVGVGGIGTAGTYSFNEYKTITCGDGGMIVTDDQALYERAFAMHDQGHAPLRLESTYAERPFLGMNFRMTELSAAVLLAQVRKLDQITSHLRANKAIVKDMLQEVPIIDYRTLPDPDGDLATHLVTVMPTAEMAADVAKEVGSRPLSESGWHTYSRMNHLLEKRTATGKGCPFDCSDGSHSHGDYRPGMLPRTDDLLARSISIGIGVRDANLAPLALGMRSTADDARALGATFRDAAIKHRP
ncbi:MAG TPA: DegT/DnrJ/EryC1/StrS family aminotransferase [Candidatus Limnocylindrales bacterium]|nr:DegT/DnrJ/EryC1/StrS family aminotransferase [Candidatus Limnocylindrales bacterium]